MIASFVFGDPIQPTYNDAQCGVSRRGCSFNQFRDASVTMDLRKEAVEVLTRFIRGEASAADLAAMARRVNAPSVGKMCESLSDELRGRISVASELKGLGSRIGLFLSGGVPREEISLWVQCLHALVTSSGFEACGTPDPAAGPTLRLLSLLLDSHHPAPLIKVRSALLRIKKCLEEHRHVPLRTFLPSVFRDMGPLKLCVLENPLAYSLGVLSPDVEDKWVDVGLTGPDGDEVRLIPFSVFTRRFFLAELPDLMTEIDAISCSADVERARGDCFCYHPENNQAIPLKERYPALRHAPLGFQYFVDETGLAEIVLDAPAIGREELLFAARLFCLQNEVRRAKLDGRRVSCTGATS